MGSKKKKMNKIYREVINNMEFKLETERGLINMRKEFKLGLITEEELFDLEWFYYETWVDPIQEIGPYNNIILN
jgi:hypothetical protein